MIFLNKKFRALKVVIRPSSKKLDKDGNTTIDEGESVHFVDGKLQTTDKKVIKVIEEYMENHQGEITTIDEKEVEKQRRIQEKARELIEEEDRKAGRDVHGKKLPEEEPVYDQYGKVITDKSVDETVVDENKALKEMTKRELLKTAKKMGLNISKKKTNDEIIKIILATDKANAEAEAAAAKSAEAAEESDQQEPDLEDESTE
jgi:hypothetical protein